MARNIVNYAYTKNSEIKVNLLCTTVRAATMIDESAQVSLSASIYYLEELKQKKMVKSSMECIQLCQHRDGCIKKSEYDTKST